MSQPLHGLLWFAPESVDNPCNRRGEFLLQSEQFIHGLYGMDNQWFAYGLCQDCLPAEGFLLQKWRSCCMSVYSGFAYCQYLRMVYHILQSRPKGFTGRLYLPGMDAYGVAVAWLWTEVLRCGIDNGRSGLFG